MDFAYRAALENYIWEIPNACDASGERVWDEAISEQCLVNEMRRRSREELLELFVHLLPLYDRRDYLKRLELLIRAGLDLNQPYRGKRSLLAHVLRLGMCDGTVRLLLANGARFLPDDFVPARVSALFETIRASHLTLLAEFRPASFHHDTTMMVNFHCARCTFGEIVDCVSSLLTLGFPFWNMDSDGWTPLCHLKRRAHTLLSGEQGYPFVGNFRQIAGNPFHFAHLRAGCASMRALTLVYNRLLLAEHARRTWPLVMSRHPRTSHPIARLSVELLRRCIPAPY